MYRPTATAEPARIPELMGQPRKESVTALWFASARSLQGWKVPASHPRPGSKEWIEPRMLLPSFPVRPTFVWAWFLHLDSYVLGKNVAGRVTLTIRDDVAVVRPI